MFHSSSQILGNTIMTIIRGQLKNDILSFVVLSGCGCCAVITFCCLPKLPQRAAAPASATANAAASAGAADAESAELAIPTPLPAAPAKTLLQKLGDFFLPVLRMLCTKQYLLLLPTLICMGLTISFWRGIIPPYAPKEHQSTLFVVRGGVYVAVAIIIGRLSDTTGRLAMCTLLHVSGLLGSTLAFVAIRFVETNLPMLYVAFVFFGIFEGCLQTQVMAIFGFLYPHSSDVAVSAYSQLRSLVAGTFFFVGPSIPLEAHFAVFMCMSTIGLVCIWILHYHVHPLDVRTQRKREAAAQAAAQEQKPLLGQVV
eukprot:GAFH01002513.1.p2 GENE.GAFH01002513.1~~GAFH01002513.1.p2  ORF type:complete len:312 (-),score=102.11 GAFH01002513.1:90-1025(-)